MKPKKKPAESKKKTALIRFKPKKKAARNFPNLIELVEESNLAAQQERERYFRPSMLDACDRANVFFYLNSPYKPPPQSPKMQRTLDTGSIVHTLIQDNYLGNSFKYYFVKEARSRILVRGTTVQGSTDGVLIDRDTSKRWVVEIKTIESSLFKLLSKPKPEHVRQAMVYCVANDAEGILFLYWDKNRSLMKQFYVSMSSIRSMKVRKRIRRRVVYLRAFADAFEDSLDPKTLPPYDKSTCYKAFCGYVKYCRKQGAPV